MKTETKAKRRGTMSITGLSFLDESELDTMKDFAPVKFELPNDNSNHKDIKDIEVKPRPQPETQNLDIEKKYQMILGLIHHFHWEYVG